jgi:hypothetical protein
MALPPADMACLARFGLLYFVFSGLWGFAQESCFYANFSLLITQSRFLIRVSSTGLNVSDRQVQKDDLEDVTNPSPIVHDRSFSLTFKKLHHSKVYGILIRIQCE